MSSSSPGFGLSSAGSDTPPAPGAGSLLGQLALVERERDLYLGLLNLSGAPDPESFLNKALALFVDLVGAERGYLELNNPFVSGAEGEVHWWTAAECSEEQVQLIRENVSRGIIAHAVAQGQVLSVPSAILDPRFRDRASVRRSRIEAVLCAPLGRQPPLGVVYLQGRSAPGPFPEADVARVEVLLEHLVPLAERLLEKHQAVAFDPTEEHRKRLDLEGVIGSSSALAALLREVELCAPLDISVLITGETGTGKSQLARVIHNNSPRRNGPLVEINCATIPESLLENELFGSEVGAHSTANARRAGKVSAADGGTLFLDEIAELSVSAQAKLLQLLQTKEYFSLGASRPTRANVRVIAATNEDLLQAIERNQFREDLYYRLQILPLRMPSIRERPEDVAPLARHFCEQAQRNHALREVRLSPEALRALTQRSWPGNVREVSHIVEAGTIRAAAMGAEQVELSHLFPGSPSTASSAATGLSFQEQTRRFQQQLLEQVLRDQDWNVSAAAKQLDLTRGHVYNLIKAFGLSRT